VCLVLTDIPCQGCGWAGASRQTFRCATCQRNVCWCEGGSESGDYAGAEDDCNECFSAKLRWLEAGSGK